MLTKLSLRSITLAHISLTFVGLLWVLPFLYYHHAYPLTTFYHEWGAVILSLCAMPLLLSKRYWLQPEIPRIVLLPVGMTLLLLLQYQLGKVASFDQALLLILYFLWMALLVMLGHRLRIELGLPLLAMVLAVCLLLGAELNALAGLVQHYRWHTILNSVVTVKTSEAVYGNIAQPNHFANYITLGLVSIGLFHIRGILRGWHAALLVLPLLFVLALSGSRSAWLYLLFIAGMTYLWQRRNPSYAPLLRYAVLLVIGFAVMNFVVQIPLLGGATDRITTIDRMFLANVGSGGIRLYLWKESWLIFTQFPLLGAGFGQFAWQHFQLGAELHSLSISGLYNNAHNLIMQLAAETGLAGLAILFGTLGAWLWAGRRAQYSVDHWWGYSVLAVLGIHSLLEYPLWYAYFIGVAAVALGMLENGTYRLQLRNLGRVSVAMMLLLGVLSQVQLYQGYKKLEASLAVRPLSRDDPTYMPRLQASLAEVYAYPLLRPYAELFMVGMVEPNADRLAEKLAMNERVMRFVPTAQVVFRQAWLLALDGRMPQARAQLLNALWSYPNEFGRALAELRQMALKDPAHFSALLEFATQKNEEYQRAVSGN